MSYAFDLKRKLFYVLNYSFYLPSIPSRCPDFELIILKFSKFDLTPPYKVIVLYEYKADLIAL